VYDYSIMNIFKINFFHDNNNPTVISFKTMRQMIGFLGMALPVLLFVWSVGITGEHFLLDSISSYYYTNTRDLFVGILCAVSFFLFSYHGYDRLDFVVFKIASISALGVAFFPAFIKSPVNPYIHIAPNVSNFTNLVHYTSALVFFLTLAFVSLILFTKTGIDPVKRVVTRRKKTRNLLYKTCGVIILLCILCMMILFFVKPENPIFTIDPVFWVETVALFAFAASWLIKGEVLFKDKKTVHSQKPVPVSVETQEPL